jgi:hypothetical protein
MQLTGALKIVARHSTVRRFASDPRKVEVVRSRYFLSFSPRESQKRKTTRPPSMGVKAGAISS